MERFALKPLVSFGSPSHFTTSTIFFTEKPQVLCHPQTTRPIFSYRCTGVHPITNCSTSNATTEQNNDAYVDIAEGYTMTQFCDKVIDVFLNEKTRAKDWKKFLIFREEWKKYRDAFYSRCRHRAEAEHDPNSKRKYNNLASKVKKVDDEMEEHNKLFIEIKENPTDLNAIVARQRKNFTGEFFLFLNLISESCDNLEERDAIARLGSRCLSSITSFDGTLENTEKFDTAQAKFEEILDSQSTEAACEKVKSLAKAKRLDSSLVLLINATWAAAKESNTMKNEAKELMYMIYKATKSSLRSMAPKEVKLLKHLLNITDPEERFSALASAFAPSDEEKDDDLYTTPKELHKWIKVMLDAYRLSREETEMREAKQLGEPVVIQRLFILKHTIEDEYLAKSVDSLHRENKE